MNDKTKMNAEEMQLGLEEEKLASEKHCCSSQQEFKNKERIQKLLEEGKITTEETERLIKALGGSECNLDGPPVPPNPPGELQESDD